MADINQSSDVITSNTYSQF